MWYTVSSTRHFGPNTAFFSCTEKITICFLICFVQVKKALLGPKRIVEETVYHVIYMLKIEPLSIKGRTNTLH